MSLTKQDEIVAEAKAAWDDFMSRDPDPRRLSRSIAWVCSRHPFYASVLMRLKRVRLKSAPFPCAVTINDEGRGVLIINHEMFDRFTQVEGGKALVHEVCHVILEHVQRIGDRNSRVWNFATDALINDIIDPEEDGLPKWCIRRRHFDQLKNVHPETAETFYEAMKGLIPPWLEDYKKALGEALKAAAGKGLDHLPSFEHSHEWEKETMGEKGPLEKETIRQIVMDADREARSQGYSRDDLPTPIKSAIEELQEEPKVPWTSIMEQFYATHSMSTRRQTMKRLHRRFRTVPGIKRHKQLHVVVVYDSSGSISDDDLAEFNREHRGIASSRDCHFTVIVCDTQVRDAYDLEEGEFPSSFPGRGGTEFEPPFEWLIENDVEPDCVVYLTDGYAAEPQEYPFPTLWVTCRNGARPAPWGTWVKMYDD